MSILVAYQPHSFSLILDSSLTYTFDPSGRPLSLYINGRYFARALSGEMKEKSWGDAQDEFDRHIRIVPNREKENILSTLRSDLEAAHQAVQEGRIAPELRGQLPLSMVARDVSTMFTHLIQRQAYVHEEERLFHRLYQPISILPPDHYFTVVLQITEGCPWNQCAFCDFYRGRAFRVRSQEEIRRHMAEVASFLKEGLQVRNSIFLSDANAFVMNTPDLMSVIAEARRFFPDQAVSPTGGISSFADVTAILGKSTSDLRRLRQSGLRRLYIGMESGSNEIRRTIRKPGTAADLVRAVHRLKEAGITVGLILMLGLGGREMEEAHVRETLTTLNALSLDPGDVLFFSPFYPSKLSAYGQAAKQNGWTPLDKPALRRQYRTLKETIEARWLTPPRIGVYDIREFVY